MKDAIDDFLKQGLAEGWSQLTADGIWFRL